MIIRGALLVLIVALLSGCLATPQTKVDAYAQNRVLSYPRTGQKIFAVAGGIVHLKAEYSSAYEYSLAQPLNTNFWLQRLVVPTNEKFRAAVVEGKEVYCSQSKVIIDILTGPFREACFILEDGKFRKAMAFPGGEAMAKEFSPPLEVSRTELILSQSGKVLKRELIFDGAQDGNLLFSERIYEGRVDVPSRSKPLVSRVRQLPMTVEVAGVLLTIEDYKSNSLTFTLDRPWQ